jgi:hypothetical protein
MENTATEINTPSVSLNPEPAVDAAPSSQVHLASPALSAGLFSEGMVPPEFSRLVVLVPDRDVDEVAFAHKIWTLLGRRQGSVLLVSLVTNGNYGPGAQRRLVTLAAVAQDVFYQIETRVIFGRSWVPGLKGIVQPGDLVVCHAMQQSRPLFGQEVALADQVIAELDRPVYLLSGLYTEPISPRPSRVLRQVALWGILAGILGAFFIFEADIQKLTTGWMSSFLFVLVFAVELFLIWLWNFFLVKN